MKDHNGKSCSELTEGTKVGKYLLVNKIGSGGMGDVYLAEDTDLNRKVALKFLSSSLASDIDCKARFIREAQAAAKLNHPNIITIHEVSEFRGRPFFAMEYVEGDSLRDISKKQDLTQAQVIDIAIQICDGLQEAHAAGIIHRDIKPSNILVDQNNRCKLLDFGLALVRGCDPLTKDKSTLGTVSYMSPEQILCKEIDNRADIFSFGIVLYELLSGDLPFKGEHDAGMMYSIVNGDPIPLQNIMQDVPSELDGLINRLLQKSPDDRFQSMADVAHELRRIRGDTSASDLSLKLRPTKPQMRFIRSRVFRIAAAVVIIGIALSAYFFSPLSSSKSTLKRVVVAPFENKTGDSSLDPFGRMIADWTTQSLLQTGLAEVIPPENLTELENPQSIRLIAHETNANAIVVGSYYKIGRTIQIQAKVMDANEKLLLAINPVAVPAEKMMDALDSVTYEVRGALAFVFDERLEELKIYFPKPPMYEAYRSYIIGLDLFTNNSGSQGIEYFNRAYSLDTTFYFPLMYTFYVYYNVGQFARADSVLRFIDLRRDRLSSLQQLILDLYINTMSGDLDKALIAAREVARISPNPGPLYDLGRTAFIANRPREAIDVFKRIDTEDCSMRGWVAYWHYFALSYHMLGDFRKELEIVKKARKLYPNNILALSDEMLAVAALGKIDRVRSCLQEYAALSKQENTDQGSFMIKAASELRAHGYEDSAMVILNLAIRWYESRTPDELKPLRNSYAASLYGARRWDQSKIIFEELAKESPDVWEYRGWIGLTAARLGDREKALEISEWLGTIKQPYLFGGNTYYRSCIAAILGDKEEVVTLLRESLSQGYSYFQTHFDMDFESLRDYPPFIELMKPKG